MRGPGRSAKPAAAPVAGVEPSRFPSGKVASNNWMVGVKDQPTNRLRNPSDLLGVVLNGLGIIVVCLLVVYAHNTAEGMAADVRSFAALLQRVLFVPVTVLDTVVIVFPLLAVGIDLLTRRRPMVALQGLLSALGGIIAAIISVLIIRASSIDALIEGLSVRLVGLDTLTIPTWVAAITAGLTAVGTPAKRRSVAWSWHLLWVAVVVTVVTSSASLPGMVIALLAGRMMGDVARYGFGVASQRAYGQSLIEGIRRAGFAPVVLDRVDGDQVTAGGQTSSKSGWLQPQFFLEHRLYVMRTAVGKTYNVIVLDGDRHVLGVINRTWRYLRSRAITGRTTMSLRETAERTALLSYAVRSAGVETPAVLAVAEADDSMLIIRQASSPARPLSTMASDEISDDIIDQIWRQLLKAHRCGVTHRSLTADCVMVTPAPTQAAGPATINLYGWETGDLASAALAKRIDLAQLLALTVLAVGQERAIAVARRHMNASELADLGPLMQAAALPRRSRERFSNVKAELAQLRVVLGKGNPDAVIEPEQITRIGARNIVMGVLVAMAIIIILTSFNLPAVVEALRASDWRWAVAAFIVGLVGSGGMALTLVAFAPVKLPFWQAFIGQLAAGFIALAAPAGLGPAAVNTRLMTRRRVPMPVAAATAALAQVTNIITVLVAMVVLTVATGASLTAFEVTPGVLVAIGLVVAAAAVVLALPRSRAWVFRRIEPLLRQTWPRLVDLFSSPLRLLLGVAGQIIAICSYITAFQWAVFAFGWSASYWGVALTYLIGTSAGSIIPTPGGMGTIEVTESATLVTLGINAGVAASIVLLFRLMTYWLRVPLGWLAYRWMQRRGIL
ncbi:MAG: flippase-like domain-containing protein [Propionibacteriaceae bacterium]|jgi:uncharacterized membrane protein YbhN (UPF0104 family)|nr:flippase-like domain-containing protein [Propionibacteriaceae bacterium]